MLHFAEFGVVLFLFLIGLELRPKRSCGRCGAPSSASAAPRWRCTGAVLAGMGHGISDWPGRRASFAGLALSLSSTAFALQILEEKGDCALRHGRRSAFAVLLFQDLAAIPLIALPPLFAVE